MKGELARRKAKGFKRASVVYDRPGPATRARLEALKETAAEKDRKR